MRILTFSALVMFLSGAAALAQTPAPAPLPVPAVGQPAQPAEAKMKPKEVRAACKEEALAQGLRGKARKASVQACFAAKRPDLAAKGDCRRQGKTQGLSGPALKDFVKTCAPAKG